MADRVIVPGDGRAPASTVNAHKLVAGPSCHGEPAMKALDRKLLRDLRLMWSQALTIALVVASGIGGFSPRCRRSTRWRWRATASMPGPLCRCVRQRQARAADALAATLRACPAWPTCRPRWSRWCASRSPAWRPHHRPADRRRPRHPAAHEPGDLRSGRRWSARRRLPADGASAGAGVRGFASARGLRPGDAVSALVNGKPAHAGAWPASALSPEYIFAGLGACPTSAALACSGSTARRWPRPTTCRAPSTAWRQAGARRRARA
jgi:putative ABC transport system permease protein